MGHNKCIGVRNGTSEEAYIEEMEEDPVQLPQERDNEHLEGRDQRPDNDELHHVE